MIATGWTAINNVGGIVVHVTNAFVHFRDIKLLEVGFKLEFCFYIRVKEPNCSFRFVRHLSPTLYLKKSCGVVEC